MSREYDIERAIRTDRVLSGLMKTAEILAGQLAQLAQAGDTVKLQQTRSEIDRLIASHATLSKQNQDYLATKPSRSMRGRPSQRRAEAEIEGEDDSPPEPQGGLEAQILTPPKGRR